MPKKEEVLSILNDLLRMDDVLACMLAKKGLGGIVPEGVKVRDVNLWNLVKSTTNEIFPIIDKFFIYKIDRLYFELGEYTIIFAPVSQTFSLLVIIPSLANMGLIDVEVENSKRKIKGIIERKDDSSGNF
ncbi:MAG: hypothetical protein NTZ73_03585 [Candidatus Diapherotrites archaeon]|nr:hypothetical protein [Candidatus Diapherotrites archaeon]